jgi:methylmalonyl-CoA/ethylmalonyl-CoA epimerase
MAVPNIQNLGQIAVVATDVERASAFYRDVLGLPFLFSAGPNLSFLMLGDVRLMVESNSNPDFGGSSTLYLRVQDIQSAVDSIRGKAELIDEPHLIATMQDHELWMSFFKDSEGNPLAFMEERPL